MLDIKKVKEEASKEIIKERTEAAKNKVKSKLKEIDNAKKVVRNLERELEDIYDELGN